jgi:predicted aspartyl protease
MTTLWKILLPCGFTAAILLAGESTVGTALNSGSREVRLRTLYQPGTMAASGAVIEVWLQNSAKPVRLLLDTGAKDVLIGARAAERSGLRIDAPAIGVVRGFSGKAVTSKVERSRIHLSNGMTFEQVSVQVIPEDRILHRDVDGLIGLNVFREYLVELDVERSRMRLTAGEAISENDEADWVRWERSGHLLMVRTECNGRDLGMALLDTGSAYSAIDVAIAAHLNGPAVEREFVSLRGVTGNLAAGSYKLPPVQFELAGAQTEHALQDRAPVAIDLADLRGKHGIRVQAVIGYPALSRSVVQLDYRGGRLRILPNR